MSWREASGRSGDQVRITAQLVDAVAGHHLWAERYDRDLNDIFGVQDEISHKIAGALKVILTSKEEAARAIPNGGVQ
jgi:adenylate cyclase